jgi:hypothetical protein
VVSISQRGKKVVKGSSGNTTSFAPCAAASSSSAIMRVRIAARLSDFWLPPIWAPAMRSMRVI